MLEQHIAVLGESGSGKTVLLSSFHGATPETRCLIDACRSVLSSDVAPLLVDALPSPAARP